MKSVLLPLLVLALAAASSAGAAPSDVRAVRVTSAVTIDGALTEPVWQSNNAVTEFLQRDPNEGTTPSQRTEVRVAYDDDGIYVGARCWDTAPDSIIARLTRRDVSIPADRFSIYLDPYLDRRSGYYFLVNAAGTLFDGTLSNDGWEDSSWDGVWDAKTKIDAQGWTVEMRIPYSQLRFQKGEHYVWGVNFRRVIPRNSEEIFVVYQPKNEAGFVSRFPHLVGIENVSPGRSIELLPYLTTKAEYLRHSALDPFNDGSEYEPDGGGDLRMGVGSRLTLNVTANPDFGQVEVDPAVVNLSDTESFFEEKRPFFVEGSSNFSFGQQGADSYWGFNFPQPTFFYTRRIGRNPQGAVPDADFADLPIGTTILGAGKLTGKLSPSVNFGTLHALTARETAKLFQGGSRWNSEIEPLTYYGVIRAQKEFPHGRQGLGLLNTVAARSFTDGGIRDQLNSQSVVTGLDGWTFLDKNKVWVISGWSAMSTVLGTKARITSLQQSPRHYFQRPDAGHIEVDPNKTSLTGFGSRYWLNKQKGQVIVNSALSFMSPNFDVNDLGFMSRTDVINGHIGGGYKWTKPTKLRKYQDVIGAVFASYDFQGNPTWGGLWGGGFTEFSNNYSFEYKLAYNPRTINTRRTRGGPVTYNLPGYELYSYFDTDGKAKLFYFLDAYGYVQESGAYNWSLSPGVEWKPVSNVTLNVGPSLARVMEDAQFVGSTNDAGASETFGRRYVFANLDQTEVSAKIRLSWAFTPAMSLQLFAQPLISSGDYSTFKQLVRSRSYAFEPLGSGVPSYDASTDRVDLDGPGTENPFNPDFNFMSLRGNAVFRWEYLPGSTLYLVWTQDRTDEEDLGDFNFGTSARRLLKADADNIFLAKVSYYFNL